MHLSTANFKGSLSAKKFSLSGQRAHVLRVPKLGRFIWTSDQGDSKIFAREVFATNLSALHFNWRGEVIKAYNLGSGYVTNIGVNLMANDFQLATAPVLKSMNYHGIGTGSTPAAASDFYLQAPIAASSLTGSTNGYMTGTQSWVSPNQYQTVATFTFASAQAVSEWGLFNANATNYSGTATATSNNSLTDANATFATTAPGLTGWTVELATSAVNSPTTTVMGQILANTATTLTILGSSASSQWLTLANGSASVPAGTSTFVVYPSMWDHKVFAPLNVTAGDSIQFTYQLTIQSGG